MMTPTLVPLILTAGLVAASPPGASPLLGSWRVDLRPAPEAAPYDQQFGVDSIDEGVLRGTFYGTPIHDGRVNDTWGEPRFAFVTDDGSGAYHTSGVLRGGRIEGATHSLGRSFLMPWRAIPDYPEIVLDPEATRAEVTLLRQAIETIHPGLHRYATPAETDAMFATLEAATAAGATDLTLYRDISLALSTLRCGHTRVEAPARLAEYRERVPTHLPFRFRILEDRMIVDVVDPNLATLARGDEILAINDVSVPTLVEKIGATVPVDGATDHIRPSRLDTAYEFADDGLDHYLPLFRDFRDDFVLRVLDRTGETYTRTVPAITLTQWVALAPGGPDNFGESVRWEMVADDTARLEVGSFINYRGTVDPVEVFTSTFRAINASGATHLVLDLRQNGGGSDDVSWALGHFLLEEAIEFRPPLVKNYRYGDDLRAHLWTWAEGALNMPDEAFRRLPDGWYELRPEASGRVARLEPHPDRFRGRVTVLIGLYNASGTTMLVARLGEADHVRLVGEPTGGSADGPTAGLLLTLTLPRTGIRVLIPALRERTPGGPYEAGAGVRPDVLVPLTVEDFLAGRDRTMEVALATDP